MEVQILDQFGNPFRGSHDSVGGDTAADTRALSQTLGSANAEVVLDLHGKAVCMVDLRSAAFNGTVVFEATINGVDYFGLPGLDVLAESYMAAVVSSTTLNKQYAVGVTGFKRVRARVSAYTSGSVAVAMRATSADYAIYARQLPATQHVTATAAVNTAVTLTLPAAGAGLFHYITNLQVDRAASAALAGSAVLVITSTNLPGSPAWSVGNAMAVGGNSKDVNYAPNSPMKCSVANTNTTVVCPAPGAGVLWRVNCSYYIGA